MATQNHAEVAISPEMIRGNFNYLLNHLDAKRIVPYFIEADLMTVTDQYEICTNHQTDFIANTKLLYKILKCGPKSLNTLQKALTQTSGSFIIDELIKPRAVNTEPVQERSTWGISCPKCNHYISEDQIYEDAASSPIRLTTGVAALFSNRSNRSLNSTPSQQQQPEQRCPPLEQDQELGYTQLHMETSRSSTVPETASLHTVNTGSLNTTPPRPIVMETVGHRPLQCLNTEIPSKPFASDLKTGQNTLSSSYYESLRPRPGVGTVSVPQQGPSPSVHGSRVSTSGYDVPDGPRREIRLFHLQNPLNISGRGGNSGPRFDNFNKILNSGDGWCPTVSTISEVEEKLTNFKGKLHSYVVWFILDRQRLVLTLMNNTELKHLQVKEKPEGAHVHYYLHKDKERFTDVRQLLEHYRENGVEVKEKSNNYWINNVELDLI